MNQQTAIKKSDGLSKKTQTNEKCSTGKIVWNNNEFTEGKVTYSNGSEWNWNNGIMKRIKKNS